MAWWWVPGRAWLAPAPGSSVILSGNTASFSLVGSYASAPIRVSALTSAPPATRPSNRRRTSPHHLPPRVPPPRAPPAFTPTPPPPPNPPVEEAAHLSPHLPGR